MSQTLHQFVGDVAHFEAGDNQYVSMSGDRRTRSLACTYFRHQSCIGLQLTVDGNIGSHLLGNLQCLNHFIHHFVLGRALGREAQHGNFRVETGNCLGCTCRTYGNLCQLFCIGHRSHSHVTHHQDTVLSIFRSMCQQQHGTRNASDARGSLDNLQSRAKYITRSVACTCQLAVSVAVLYNQAAQIKRIDNQLASLFDGHAFLFAELAKQLGIFFFLRMVFRVDNGSFVYISQPPLFGTSLYLGRFSKDNQVGYSVSQDLIGSFQCTLFRTLGKNNSLAVCFGTLNNFVN